MKHVLIFLLAIIDVACHPREANEEAENVDHTP